MGDWYNIGFDVLINDGVNSTEVSEKDFRKVYAFLSEVGLIDYDTEKEVFYDIYEGRDV